MKVCNKCNSTVEDSYEYCPYCGNKLDLSQGDTEIKNNAGNDVGVFDGVLPILGFILSFISCIVGLVLSIIGKKKTTNATCRGLAIAGIVISIINIVFRAYFVILYCILLFGF